MQNRAPNNWSKRACVGIAETRPLFLRFPTNNEPMNEYRFRGTRRSDGAPVESRMCARSETDLERALTDFGITFESAELLSSESRNQTVSLGCGTLILIAIIVMIFSGDDNNVERELRQLQQEVQQLKSAVEAQSRTLEEFKSAGEATTD